jgi:hypothetical protein
MYGILFSNELQKMAWGLKQLEGGMTRRQPTMREDVPATPPVNPRSHGQPQAGVGRSGLKPAKSLESPNWYQSSNTQPQFDMTAENMGIPAVPKQPKDAQYYANAMRADYAKQQAKNIKIPAGIDFNQRINAPSLAGSGGGSGGFSAMRGASPQR